MKNMCGIETYRAPLGRRKLLVIRYPARWAGLRDVGPLGQSTSASLHRRRFSANGAQLLSAAQWAGYASPTNILRPKRPRYDRRQRMRPPGEILKALGQLEAEIQQGMKELEGMLK